MKPSKYAIRVAMWALMLGITAYFVVYAFHYFFGNLQTELLYTYTAEESETVSGYIFREEQVISTDETLVEVTAAEGEKLAVGGEIALLYDSADAMESHQYLTSLENELSVLTYIRSHVTDDADNGTLDSQISDAIVALRAEVSRGELDNLEDLANGLKNLVYRQDYTYNDNDTLDLEIAALRAEVNDLSARMESNVSTLTAERSGFFSSMVDGYESVFTPDALSGLTPSGLKKLVNSREAVDSDTALGKLVCGNTWYFAASIPDETAERLTKGGSVTLRFTSVGDITFEVVSLSEAENGEVAVVFSTTRSLSETTLLRDQTVTLVLDTETGFRVSSSAVKVLDNSSGQTGIYRVYGTQIYWVEVEVLYRGEDYFLIAQKTEYNDDGSEKALSSLEEAQRLREGAEIVTAGKNLYDGKVISSSN